jgi:hypothetical protein
VGRKIQHRSVPGRAPAGAAPPPDTPPDPSPAAGGLRNPGNTRHKAETQPVI